jgi:hypothetical protein
MSDGRFVVKVPKKTNRKAAVIGHADPVWTDEDLEETINDMARLQERVDPPAHPYKMKPVEWIKEKLGEHVWSKQAQICESVRDNRFTAVKSCHQIGKSFIASRIAAWWYDTHEDAYVITTAPSSHQVKTILWKEIRRAHKKGGLAGKITEGQVPEWKVDGETVGFGRKPADYTNQEDATTQFQGIHATNLLVIMDEGSGIPTWLVTAIETLIGNENARVLAIGNPDNPTSEFAKMFKPGSDYNKITVRYDETPAFTDEVVPDYLYDMLISKVWVEERRRKWGERSPLWFAKVLAEFPVISDDTVFSPHVLAIGIATERSSAALRSKQDVAAWDVARMGTDENALYLNKNGYVRLVDMWGRVDTMESVGRIRRHWPNGGSMPSLVIDIGGVGGGPYDRLRELHYNVAPFDGGGRALNPDRYKNRRAEAYWEAREAMEEGLIDLEELDEDLQAELLEIKFKTTSTGKIQLEEKEEVHKRLGRSPNRADAFVMSLQKAGNWMKILGKTDRNSHVRDSNSSEVRVDVNTGQPIGASFDFTDVDPDDLVAGIMEMNL